MAMIIDAIARHGVRGAIGSLLSPQNTTSVRAENSTPRYVCARKKYQSGRRGRICVYRISDQRTNRDGRKVRLYTNVEGVNIDEDERRNFTGIVHTSNYNRGRSTRQKKGRTPPTPDKAIKSKIEPMRLDVKPYDLSDEGSDRRSKGHGMAPAEAKGSGSSLSKESVAPRPVNSRKHSRRKSIGGPHREVGIVERHRSPSRTLRRQKASRFVDRTSREISMQEEFVTHCSGALPILHHQHDRRSLKPAPTQLLRNLRETTIGSTTKVVNDVGGKPSRMVEHHHVDGKHNDSVGSEAPGSPFRQPGLTLQESSDLVFGTDSKVETRRKLRVGRMDDRIAPDVHEFASQIVRDDPLGEAEQETDARSPSEKPHALGLEHSPSGVREAENPLGSQAQAIEDPPQTVTSTWISRINLPASASAVHHCCQNRRLGPHSSAGGSHGATEAKGSSFPPQQQIFSGMPELGYAKADATSDPPLSTAIPGTPPYTPQKGGSNQE
jgi:hypothetical protein